jgi:hypothetical protein
MNIRRSILTSDVKDKKANSPLTRLNNVGGRTKPGNRRDQSTDEVASSAGSQGGHRDCLRLPPHSRMLSAV